MVIRVIDLTSDDEQLAQQAAHLLLDGFPADTWNGFQDALEQVHEVMPHLCRAALDTDNTLLGWIGGLPQYDGHVWELHPLVVRPAHQGKGIGRTLVEDFERCVWQRGGLTLLLGTDDEHAQTSIGGVDVYPDPIAHLARLGCVKRHPVDFYRALGFVVVGMVPDANGYGKPDILMAKRVTAPASGADPE